MVSRAAMWIPARGWTWVRVGAALCVVALSADASSLARPGVPSKSAKRGKDPVVVQLPPALAVPGGAVAATQAAGGVAGADTKVERATPEEAKADVVKVVVHGEAPGLPRRESKDDDGYTVVQLPNGFFRYQRDADEKPESDAGLVTITERSYVAGELARGEARGDAREMSPPARGRARDEKREPTEAEELAEACRRQRGALAQRVLQLRGLTNVDPAMAELMITEIEGGPSWIATAVLGTGVPVPHPAFPWRILTTPDGQPVRETVVSGPTATMSDAHVRWSLEDLAKCEARVKHERELRR